MPYVRQVLLGAALLVTPGPDRMAAAQAASAGEQPPPADQAAPPPPGQREFGEEILVTGSRIRRKDLTTAAPVTVVTREQFQASGVVSLADFLQHLPVQGNAANTSINNGGDGATRIDLRGLGDHRTLVLLNGRRFVPGGLGADASVDLDSIPSAAIERVEILKDGASAVYGSDAIGGVVNVITRRTWSGVEAQAYSGMSSRGDGQIYDLSVTAGQASDAGHILASVGYTDRRQVMAGDRSFSRVEMAYDPVGDGQSGNPLGLVGPYGVGSRFVPAGYIVVDAGVLAPNPAGDPRIDRYNQLVSRNPTASSFIFDPSDPLGWRPYRGDALSQYGGDGYNYAPENYLVTPQQRLSLYSAGDWRLGSHARAYFEAAYVSRQSGQDLAPETLGTGGYGVVVSKDNQYNPFGVDLPYVRRRLVELGRRRFRQNVDAYRVVAGLDGTVPGGGPLRGWTWDLSFNRGGTAGILERRGMLRPRNLQEALGPSYVDTNGAYHCGAAALPGGGEPLPGCVPLNLFGGPGSITPDQLERLTFTGTSHGSNDLVAAQTNLSGELFHVLSERAVGLAAGYEYRRQSGSLVNDPISTAGETTAEPATRDSVGSQSVHEAYVELGIPIVSGHPFVDDLEATAAARISRYQGFATDWTYKLGGRWRPVRDVTLRGTVSTAFRAPNIVELYQGASYGLVPAQYDPCAGPALTGSPSPASCGAAADHGNPSEFMVRSGGNPGVGPEKARTFTAGVVLEPRFVRNFSLTVDLWAIRVSGEIGTVGGTTILQSCYPADPSAAPRWCQLVQRDPATHRILTLSDVPVNIGSEKASGVDLAAQYALPTVLGRFGLFFDGTWLQRHDITLGDGTVVHAKGTYDWPSIVGFDTYYGAVRPAYKFNTGATWARGGLGTGMDVRYLGSFRECFFAPPDNRSGACYIDSTYSRRVRAYATLNAFASYALPSPHGKTSLALGVNNVLDTAPARVYTGFVAASDPTAYDFMGRYFYLRLSHRL